MSVGVETTIASRTRVKFCGFTRPADVDCAVSLGIDALGLVFYEGSPRAVSLEAAVALREHLSPFVALTALFVDPDPEYVEKVIAQVRPQWLQFHGDESPAFCQRYELPYIKAFRVGNTMQPAALVELTRPYAAAGAWLFDSQSAGFGGSGHAFDWQILKALQHLPQARPIILSGGLTADRVAAAVRDVQPYALDVSSGIETIDAQGRTLKGQKSAQRMTEFMRSVIQADQYPI